MTATAQTTLTAAAILAAIKRQRISLVPAHRGRVWMASVDLPGAGHNRKRNIRSVSAVASSPIGAIVALIEKLGAGQSQLWKEEEAA